jgi:hypothetical protein
VLLLVPRTCSSLKAQFSSSAAAADAAIAVALSCSQGRRLPAGHACPHIVSDGILLGPLALVLHLVLPFSVRGAVSTVCIVSSARLPVFF